MAHEIDEGEAQKRELDIRNGTPVEPDGGEDDDAESADEDGVFMQSSGTRDHPSKRQSDDESEDD